MCQFPKNGVVAMEYEQWVSHGEDNVNGMFSEFMNRAGRKIKTTTDMGVQKPGLRRDSFNDRMLYFCWTHPYVT